jgi:hypothetical protein
MLIMKKQPFWIISMLAASLLVVGCDDEDVSPVEEKVYTLAALDNSGVSGTVTFTKQSESMTKVLIQVSGTTEGNSHPAHIHSNAASAGGPIVADLNPVDGATGRSETMVSKLNDGTAITYDQLITFNGHVNLHKSATELAIMITQGDIGANATGTSGGNGYN